MKDCMIQALESIYTEVGGPTQYLMRKYDTEEKKAAFANQLWDEEAIARDLANRPNPRNAFALALGVLLDSAQNSLGAQSALAVAVVEGA